MDVLASRENQRNAENRYRYTDNSRGARSAQMILVLVLVFVIEDGTG